MASSRPTPGTLTPEPTELELRTITSDEVCLHWVATMSGKMAHIQSPFRYRWYGHLAATTLCMRMAWDSVDAPWSNADGNRPGPACTICVRRHRQSGIRLRDD